MRKFNKIPQDEEERINRPRDSHMIRLESEREYRPPSDIAGRFGDGVATAVKSSNEDAEESKSPIVRLMYRFSWIIQMVIAHLLYRYSLEACQHSSNRKCFKEQGSSVKYWVLALFLASHLFVAAGVNQVVSILKSHVKSRPVDKLNLLFLFFTLIHYFYLNSLEPGLSWRAHGTFSRIVFNYCAILFFGLRVYNVVLRFAVKLSKQAMLVGKLLLFIVLLVALYNRVLATYPSFFVGFQGKTVETNGKLCNWHKFNLNYYSAFDELFWNLAHKDSDCSAKSSEIGFIKEKGKESKYFAYPLSTKMNETTRQHYQLLEEATIKGIEPVTANSPDKEGREVFIDLSTETPKIVIDIQRNETLIEKMKEVIKKENQLKYRPNVLFIMLDSISRQHFFRKMKKSAQYFDQQFFDKEKKDKKLYGHQFFRYHSLSSHSEANLLAMRYDDAMAYGEQSHRVRIERYFKEKGYITSTASAKCEVDEFDIPADHRNRVYPDPHPMDHEFFSIACDPNATPKDDPFGMYKGPFSEFRRCVYGKDAAEYQFEYSLDFWRKYKDVPKIQTITLMDGHEMTGELPYYLDGHLVNYLETMQKESLLDDAIIFVLSDNGNAENFLFSQTESGKIEAANPFLSVLLSPNNEERFGEVLNKNEQKLVSPHDIFRVLGELCLQFKEYVGFNFFTQELQDERRCNDNDLSIDLNFCRCK